MLQLIQPAARLATQEKTGILFSVLITRYSSSQGNWNPCFIFYFKSLHSMGKERKNKVSQNEVKGKNLGKEQVIGPVWNQCPWTQTYFWSQSWPESPHHQAPKGKLRAAKLRTLACAGEVGIELNSRSQQTANSALVHVLTRAWTTQPCHLLWLAKRQFTQTQSKKPWEKQWKPRRSLSARCALSAVNFLL